MPPSNLLLASKVVVVEEPPQIRSIAGVATSIAAFAGVTERGAIGAPTFVTSWDEFVREFGGYIAESDLPQAVFGFFQNGGTAAWIKRITHYTDITDDQTSTAAKGSLTILDRGGSASAAVLDSEDGPFDLEPGEVLEVNVDGGGPDTLTFAATSAEGTSGAGPFDLSGNDKTFTYTVKAPKSATAEEARTITFVDADFSNPAAATAQEVINAINSRGQFIRAALSGGNVRVFTDKRGTGAEMIVAGTAGAILGGTLVNGTKTGTGNVADIDAVTATEIAALLTALTLGGGTATVVGDKVRLATTATGAGAEVIVTANTTALGIFAGALPITETGAAAGTSDTLTVTARDEGTHIEDYSIVIEAPTSGDSTRFNLRVKKGTRTVETWPNLSMTDADARYVESIVNANSKLIRVTDEDSGAGSPNDLPALGTYSVWAGADDGLVGLVDVDFTGDEAAKTGLYGFDVANDITILAVPGRATSAVHNAMITYCEVHRVGTVFPILDPPENLDEQQIKTYVETTAALYGLSEFGAIYWPRVKVLNPSTVVFGSEDQIVVPPSGHLAGLYARIDGSRPGGIFIAPAGVENGRLFGVLGFETDDTLDERKRDVVYPARINPITKIDGGPIHVDGSRTLKGDGNFPSVSERRGVIFIERSIKTGTLFAKHRNNDRRLRMEVKRAIEAFLLRQYGVGAFRGDTPAESFYVDVSDSINTIERIFAGELHVRIGLATQKPADWVIITVTQDTRELEERLASLNT